MSTKKSIIHFALISIISLVLFVVYKNTVEPKKYEFYTREDENNCNSPYKEKPYLTAIFIYKKETSEIFMTIESEIDGRITRDIDVLEKCSVVDARNWRCGGVVAGTYITPKYTFINGEFSYADSYSLGVNSCPVKVVQK
jgi:hypothetical protein